MKCYDHDSKRLAAEYSRPQDQLIPSRLQRYSPPLLRHCLLPVLQPCHIHLTLILRQQQVRGRARRYCDTHLHVLTSVVLNLDLAIWTLDIALDMLELGLERRLDSERAVRGCFRLEAKDRLVEPFVNRALGKLTLLSLKPASEANKMPFVHRLQALTSIS